MLYSLIV